MPRRRVAKLVEREISLRLPRLKRLGSAADRAVYHADLMTAEGLESLVNYLPRRP